MRTREDIIRDLSIMLLGSIHPSAQIGPAPRLAAKRLAEALGVKTGDGVAEAGPRLTWALMDSNERRAAHYAATGHMADDSQIDELPIVCANGCPGGYFGIHKFSCDQARRRA